MLTVSWLVPARRARALTHVTGAAVLAACGAAEQITTVRPAQAGRPSPLVADVRLSLPGDDGALVVGLAGATVDSASAPDVVVTALPSEDGEARLVIAGVVSDGTVVRVWGSAPSGAPLTAVVREAVATTLETRNPAGRTATAIRVR